MHHAVKRTRLELMWQELLLVKFVYIVKTYDI